MLRTRNLSLRLSSFWHQTRGVVTCMISTRHRSAILVTFIVAFGHRFNLIKLAIVGGSIIDLVLQFLKGTGLRELLQGVHSDHLGTHTCLTIGWHHDHGALIVRNLFNFGARRSADTLGRSHKVRVSFRTMVLRDRYSQISLNTATSEWSSFF